MADDPDYLIALEMQQRWNSESDGDASESHDDTPEIVDFKMPPPSRKPLQIIKRSNPHSNLDPEFLNRTQNLVHPQWETLDPTPDVHALFNAFDAKFFQSRLKCVTLEWSKKMYSCAGICYMQKNREHMAVTIRLSQPLLILRPRKDLVETMLHEMIHAYCFTLNIREGNGGHGPNFKKIMYGINKVAGTNITVYHSFHDEVEVYRQHWWRCNGSCQNRSPFFGYVKRTSNRAPGPNDQWWSAHMESCGGTFMKIKSPEKKKKECKKDKKLKEQNSGADLRKFFPPSSDKNSLPNKNGNNINGLTNGAGYKGPIKFNGGGTMVLNPRHKYSTTTTDSAVPRNTTSVATLFPPTSYPGLSSDPFNSKNRSQSIVPPGGNLLNVVGFRDLNSSLNSTADKGRTTFDTTNKGYSLTSNKAAKTNTSTAVGQVDRDHLRKLWSNRFVSNGSGAGSANNIENNSIKRNNDINGLPLMTGDAKRRRLSSEGSVICIEDDAKNTTSKTKGNNWIVVDDDVMLQEKPEEIIALSSGSDDDDSDVEPMSNVPRKMPIKLNADERQTAIKQEILDGNSDESLTDNDIILLDDDYDDEQDVLSTAAAELADTSLIDDFFGEDTLLKEFKRENDVMPSSSHHVPKPEDDIITCPICQGKMKRSQLSEHLDGCTGIAIKIQPPKHALKKIASTPKVLNPSRRLRPSKKDILRKAGYTEEDIFNIASSSSAEEEDFLNTSELKDSSSSPKTKDALNFDESEFPRRHRQRNLFKTTRQCPICAQEIEEDEMNDHLDECLAK